MVGAGARSHDENEVSRIWRKKLEKQPDFPFQKVNPEHIVKHQAHPPLMPTPFTPSPSTFNNATTPMSHNIEAACVSHYAHVGHGELVVLFVFSSLIMGTLLEWTMHKVPLPHTSVLLIAGFFIGLIVNNSEDPESILGQFGKGTNETAKINPHLLLFIFLPPLIFHSAFSIHWHVFKKVFSQVMTLALPGLSMAMVLTGISMKWMYPSWSWSSVFLFGTSIS